MTQEVRDIAVAFRDRRKCKRHRTSTDGDTVWLHGNRIAWRDDAGIVWLTLAGWPTPTTRGRLNAIAEAFEFGMYFYQQKQVQYVRYFDAHPNFGSSETREIHPDDCLPATTGVLSAQILEIERARSAQAHTTPPA